MYGRVSLCVIAKNEEANLVASLQSVAGLVDEVIVADTGSIDRTKEVAVAQGARVVDFVWCDDFAAARNASIVPATGEWIFWLDGDEYLDDTNRTKLRLLIENLRDETAAYVMKQRSPPPEPGASPTDVDQVRLFRNRPNIRWQYRVHEQILPALNRAGAAIRFTDIAVEHTGYQDDALRAKKLERNLRLLHLEDADHPHDPFTLFNLGWAYQELGRTAESMPLLWQSLKLSQPSDSIVRKLYVLLVHGHRRLRQRTEALAACRAGRARFPDDVELLFLEGQTLLEGGSPADAEACLRVLLRGSGGTHFASVDVGLRGHKTRHLLGLACQAQGRLADAETEWQAALSEKNDYAPSLLNLGELYLTQGRWNEFENVAACLQSNGTAGADSTVLRARSHLARCELKEARRLLEGVVETDGRAIEARIFLTHVLLREEDWPLAEITLRAVLELEPRHAESWRNLAVLLRQLNRLDEALAVCQAAAGHCPDDPELIILRGDLLHRHGDLVQAEACLIGFLQSQPESLSNGAVRDRQWRARVQLARLYQGLDRLTEAETQWRAALTDRPDFRPGWIELGEIHLVRKRWDQLEQVAERLTATEGGQLDAALLRSRGHLARQEFIAARSLLDDAIRQAPNALGPQIILSHVCLQEDKDEAEAEQVLRRILELDPSQADARHNLALLLRRGNVSQENAVENQVVSSENAPTVVSRDAASENAGPAMQRSERLRIAFASFTPFSFRPETPYQEPLGGSESALCYLAEALASAGHEVFVLNAVTLPEVSRGVRCFPLNTTSIKHLPPLDAFVIQNCAGQALALRPALSRKTPLILWMQHAHDQPAVQPLSDAIERKAYDGFVFLSEWQAREFFRHLRVEPKRTAILGNAVCPVFQDMYGQDATILSQKRRPPVMAYTSTPSRGLELLLDAFPRIRERVTGATLKVFSSMQVYRVPENEDRERYGALYERCRSIEGVQYVGSVPQSRLADELRRAAVLAYPNTFPETFCTAALEAMAAGCVVVTSALAALPETANGFARLVPVNGDWKIYVDRFVDETVAALNSLAEADSSQLEEQLRKQVDHVNHARTWEIMAWHWTQFLSRLRPAKVPVAV